MNEEWVALQVKVPFLELFAQFFISLYFKNDVRGTHEVITILINVAMKSKFKP